jgi:hypothetical protein
MGLAETAELAVNLNLKGNFVQGMGKAQAALTKTAGSTMKLGKAADFKNTVLQGFGMGAGITAFGLMGRAVMGTVGVLGDAVNVAMAEQRGIAQLSASPEANAAAWDGNIEAIEEGIRARETLGFEDDKQRESLALLTAGTKDAAEAQRLLDIAMGLSRLRSTDLVETSTLLSKVYQGNYTAFKRFGLSLGDVKTREEALLKVQELVAGQTAKYAETDLGKLEIAQIAANNAMEDFGNALMPIVTDLMPHLTNAIGLLSDAFAKPSLQQQSFQTWVDGLAGIKDGLAEVEAAAVGVGSGLGTFEDIWADTPLGLLAPSMSEAVKLWREYGTELEAVGLSFYDFKDGLNTIKIEMGKTGEEAANMILEWATVEDVTQQADAAITSMSSALNGAIKGLFGTADAADDLTDSEDKAAAAAKRLESAMQTVAGTSLSGIRSEFKSVQKAIEEAAKSKSCAALQLQVNILQGQRGKYMREGEFDVVAIIDAEIASRKEQIAAFRTNSRAKRGLLGQEGKAAEEAGAAAVGANDAQQTALGKTQRELDDTTSKVNALKSAASGGATLVVNVDDSALTALRSSIEAAKSALGTLPWAGGAVSTPAREPNVKVKADVNVSAHAVARGTDRVRSTRRSGNYTQ